MGLVFFPEIYVRFDVVREKHTPSPLDGHADSVTRHRHRSSRSQSTSVSRRRRVRSYRSHAARTKNASFHFPSVIAFRKNTGHGRFKRAFSGPSRQRQNSRRKRAVLLFCALCERKRRRSSTFSGRNGFRYRTTTVRTGVNGRCDMRPFTNDQCRKPRTNCKQSTTDGGHRPFSWGVPGK